MAPSKHLVLVCGFARAGKDTFAKGLIAAAKDAKRVAYADSLKYALQVAACQVGISVDYFTEADKLQDRDLLVEFGRAMRRRDKDVFAKTLGNHMDAMTEGQTLVVSDWRYLNEHEVAKAYSDRYGFKLHTVRIVRHGWKAANDEEAMSLVEIMEAVPFDETIHATSGDEEAVLLAGIRTAKLWNL
jgi:hypothetical protein